MTEEQQAPMRSFESWSKSLRNFSSWVGDSVSGGSDLDFACEHKGHIIILESKPYCGGVKLPWGQHKMLNTFSKLPRVSVYLVGEGAGDTLHIMPYNAAMRPEYRRPNAVWFAEWFIPTTKEGMRAMLSEWWDRTG